MPQGDKANTTNIPKLKGFSAPSSNTNPVRQAPTERTVPTVISQTATPTPVAPMPTTVAPPTQPEPLPDLLGLDEPSLPPSTSSNTLNLMASNKDDPLHDLFSTHVPVSTAATTTAVTSTTTTNTTNDLEKDLESAFLPTNQSTSGGMMTTDKIMALFNQPPPILPTATPVNQPLVNFSKSFSLICSDRSSESFR